MPTGRPLPPSSRGQGRFRSDLDISSYVEAVGGFDFMMTGRGRKLSKVEQETIRREREAYDERIKNTPQRMSSAPTVASSCQQMSTRDLRVIWDVAGYYRALGFVFPFRGITKAMLRAAFVELDGPNNAHLMRIFKLLLDPGKRRVYDAAQPDQVYFDEIRHYEIQQKATYEASRRSSTGVYVSKEDVLSEWGLETLSEDQNSPAPGVDSVAPVGHSAEDPAEGSWTWWPWGYYLWGSQRIDFVKLAGWQAALVREFASRGVRQRFAVGLHAREHPLPWVTAVSGRDFVVFLHEDADPTDGNAAAVAVHVLTEHADENEKRGQA